MNIPHILRIKRFRHQIDDLLRNSRLAGNQDVKDALEIAQARRSNGWKWFKGRDAMLSFTLPNSMFYKMRRGLENCDEDEKKAWIEACRKELTKLAY